MRASLAVCLIAWLGLGAAPAWSELVISAGREGGSYHGVALRLRSELTARIDRHMDVVSSAGSLDNLERLDDPKSRVNVAFTQTDALDHYLSDHPEFRDEFIVLGDLGRECVFIVSNREGPIRSGRDLKRDAGYQISLDAPGSGAAVTFEHMARIEPAFGNTSPVFVDPAEALLQIRSGGSYSSLKAAMFVQRPLRRSRVMQAVLDDPESFRFVPLTRDDLRSPELPDGSTVYEFQQVTAGGKQRRDPVSVETLCVQGLMLGAKQKLSEEMRALVPKLMLESGARIIGADE
jgi:hypothetical protein